MAERHDTEHKSFGTPDEARESPNGCARILHVGGGEVGRLVFEPGRRWSNDVEPLEIGMDDGPALVAKPRDVLRSRVAHEGWVAGDEPAVVVEWYGASNYAAGRLTG